MSIWLAPSCLTHSYPSHSFKRNKIWMSDKEVLLFSHFSQCMCPAVKALGGKFLSVVNAHTVSSNMNTTTDLSLTTFLFTIIHCIPCRKPFTIFTLICLDNIIQEKTCRWQIIVHCHLLQITDSKISALQNTLGSSLLHCLLGSTLKAHSLHVRCSFTAAPCLTLAVDSGGMFLESTSKPAASQLPHSSILPICRTPLETEKN